MRTQTGRNEASHERRNKAGASEVRAGQRIAKVMARAGVCSRRDAEAWIADGRVSVNGEVLTSPAFNVSETDDVRVDGKPLAAPERTRLFLFHKPRGLVTTARDPEGRQTVFAVLPPDLPRLVAIGRLDINTEGLLLLTNDGGLARVLELPSTGWLRRYRVRAHGNIDQAALDRLVAGSPLTASTISASRPSSTASRAQTPGSPWASGREKTARSRRSSSTLGLRSTALSAFRSVLSSSATCRRAK